MKKNGVCSLGVMDMEWLLTNFPNEELGLDFFKLFESKDKMP